MANRSLEMGLILVLVTMFWAGARAQSSCTNVLISLSPCLNYITGNSSTPSSQCCTQLASVVRSSPQCLCQVLNGGGSSLGIDVNQTQALALPNACNVQTPPTSSCNADAPAGSPESSSTVPGSKTVPATEGGPSSDGSSIKLSFSLLVFLLFAASYSSIFTTY
ncbi:non-specific lipid-transfer protein-like protein At2g13820 [Pistacia vera]|uniref:non-specific lipid-transfer protein-like protein At2g13820 n=1 Tax=Pistacia vera TaxID=55513 RepID=UPI001262F20F|nr:non-specific lipid-transfer protein-like protein At2g13820 [Pistacia vera]XP_031278186.1 non-specific lipid-transfer protein-like protein At2g13820 [Pistacia vera]